MIELLERLFHSFQNSVEYVIVSTLIAVAALMGVSNVKYGWKYIVSSIMLGSLFGFTAHNTPLISDFSFIAAIAGTLAGPATLAALQHKTLMDLYKIYVDLTDGKDDDAKDSTGSGSGVEEEEGGDREV